MICSENKAGGAHAGPFSTRQPTEPLGKVTTGSATSSGWCGAGLGRTSSTKAGSSITLTRQGSLQVGGLWPQCLETLWQELLHSWGR